MSQPSPAHRVDKPQAPPEIQELTPQEWNRWRHHPVTKAFLTYLRDYRQLLRLQHLERWERNALGSVEFEAAERGQANLAEYLVEMRLNEVRAAYELELFEEPEQSSEASQSA